MTVRRDVLYNITIKFGLPLELEGSCECIEYAVADSRQGVVLQLGVGSGANNTSP
jgi:hypothetical protein